MSSVSKSRELEHSRILSPTNSCVEVNLLIPNNTITSPPDGLSLDLVDKRCSRYQSSRRHTGLNQKRTPGLLGFCPKVLHGRLGAGTHVQFVVDLFQVTTHGVLGKAERGGNFFVYIALRYQCQHLLLPYG